MTGPDDFRDLPERIAWRDRHGLIHGRCSFRCAIRSGRGGGEVNTVLDLLYVRMAAVLTDYDHMVLPSSDVTPRCRNTAQWARNSLRKRCLLCPVV